MTKEEISQLVEATLQDSVTDIRKRSIVASIVATGESDRGFITKMIERLGARKPETALSYSAGLNKCVNCKGNYEDVYLHNKRPAFYCSRCRIAAPKAVRNE